MSPVELTVTPPAAGTTKGSVAEILRMGATPGLPGWATGSDVTHLVWKGFERASLSKVIPEFVKASGFEASLVQTTIDSSAANGGVSDQIAAASMAKAMKAAVWIIAAVQHPTACMSVSKDLASVSSVVSLPTSPEEPPTGSSVTSEPSPAPTAATSKPTAEAP